MTEVYTDVMIDIETTGTMPDRAGILQIAGVKFNLQEKTVSPDFFEACLTLPAHRHWDMDTRAWWMRQKPSILQDILARQRDWRTVMEEFQQWVVKTPGVRFWAKPTTFDFMFCASYFKDADLMTPFHYNNVTDMASFLHGIHYPNPVPKIDVTVDGDAHNALTDCFWQLKTIWAHIDEVKNVQSE